jgi:hypothetical protein
MKQRGILPDGKTAETATGSYEQPFKSQLLSLNCQDSVRENILPVSWDRQTDMTKLTVAFRKFPNAPKRKENQYSSSYT